MQGVKDDEWEMHKYALNTPFQLRIMSHINQQLD